MYFSELKDISANNKDRMDPVVRAKYQENAVIDCHCHLFNEKSVPKRLMGIKVPYSYHFGETVAKILHWLNPFSKKDKFSRLSNFINLMLTSPHSMAKDLTKCLPENTLLCSLMMDMEWGRSRKELPVNFVKKQSKEIRELLDAGFLLLPFIAIDPMNEDAHKNFVEGFLKKNGINPMGIKIYPTMGYLPSHPKLLPIYETCMIKHIPVTAHCSRGVIHGYRNRIKDIKGLRILSSDETTNKPVTRWFFSGKAYSRFFNDPTNWIPVLKRYPDLRLNLGHFGGGHQWIQFAKRKKDTWVDTIIDLMKNHPNVYADISFTLAYPQLLETIKYLLEKNPIVQERMLFGTDYTMVVAEGHISEIYHRFKNAMGPSLMQQISVINPRKFLFE